jgi:hypothetical protein
MSIFVSSQLCTCFIPTVFVCMLLMTHNIPIYYNLKLHLLFLLNSSLATRSTFFHRLHHHPKQSMHLATPVFLLAFARTLFANLVAPKSLRQASQRRDSVPPLRNVKPNCEHARQILRALRSILCSNSHSGMFPFAQEGTLHLTRGRFLHSTQTKFAALVCPLRTLRSILDGKRICPRS